MSPSPVVCPCRDCRLDLLIPGRVRPDHRTRCGPCRRSGGYAAHLFTPGLVPPPARPRSDPNPLHRYVRRVRRSYQARVWLAETGFVNLGLFPSIHAAKRVALACIRAARPVDALTLWRAALALPADWGVSPRLLPKYVYAHAGGSFGARVGVGDRKIVLGPFPDPESAHRAMVAAVQAARRAKIN